MMNVHIICEYNINDDIDNDFNDTIKKILVIKLISD